MAPLTFYKNYEVMTDRYEDISDYSVENKRWKDFGSE
jgi:hypothetical protein